MKQLFFNKLTLKNFRNYNFLDVDFSKNINIFIGKNGQGKTNLLEAIYYLIQGKSFRYLENDNLKKTNETDCAIEGRVLLNELDFKIKTIIHENKNETTLNSKKVSRFELQNKFPLILFSPESLSIIKESDEQRRQFIDEHLEFINPANKKLILEYRKILKTKNKVLKNFRDQITTEKDTTLLLESINPLFVKKGAELTFSRINAIKLILPYLQKSMSIINGSENVEIAVEYLISGQNCSNLDSNQVEQTIGARVEDLAHRELLSGASLVGPHRHDISFIFNKKNARFYCSQGQQRALILSFKMAQIVYHRTLVGYDPVLMLDDVLSELDFDKKEALISFLKEIKSQIFITTTDLLLHDKMDKQGLTVFNIADGNVLERSLL